jgi:hypothetical protein
MPLKQAIISVAGSKLLRKTVAESPEAKRSQRQLGKMLEVIEADEGWKPRVCIHTDKWQGQERDEQTMCFMTAVKHLQCTDAERSALERAFKVVGSLPSPLAIRQAPRHSALLRWSTRNRMRSQPMPRMKRRKPGMPGRGMAARLPPYPMTLQ